MLANELRHAARGYRATHVKTLSHVTAYFDEAAEGRFSFDALGYTLQSEFPCQVDDDLDDDLAATVVHHLHDKASIDSLKPLRRSRVNTSIICTASRIAPVSVSSRIIDAGSIPASRQR